MGIDPSTHRPIIRTSDHHHLINILISHLNDQFSNINPWPWDDQFYNITNMINAVAHDHPDGRPSTSQIIADKMQAAALMHNMILVLQLLQLVRSSTSTNTVNPTIINNKLMEAITRNIVLGPSPSTTVEYQQQLYHDECLTNRSSWNSNMNQCHSRAAVGFDSLTGNIVSPAGLTSFSTQNPTDHNDDEDGDHYLIHTNVPNSEAAAPQPADDADYSNKEMSNHQQQLINGSSSSYAIPNVNDHHHQLPHIDDWGITTNCYAEKESSNINNPIYNSITSSASTTFDANINWGDLLIE